jgi:hypothetical protein
MNAGSLLTAGVVAVSVIAFETWFRVTSLKEIDRKQQEVAQARTLSASV